MLEYSLGLPRLNVYRHWPCRPTTVQTYFCRMFESDPEEGIKQCHNLLLETDLEASVRYGDVYGLLIEYYATRENYEKVQI